MGGQAYIQLDQTRWREDDGNETGATWRELVNEGTALDTDTNYRIRFGIHNYGGTKKGFTAKLQVRKNAVPWADVTAVSNDVILATSVHYTDGDNTTQQITTGDYVAVNNGMDNNDGVAGSATLDIGADGNMEFEYCFKIVDSDVKDGDFITLSVSESGLIDFDFYAQQASFGVRKRNTLVDPVIPKSLIHSNIWSVFARTALKSPLVIKSDELPNNEKFLVLYSWCQGCEVANHTQLDYGSTSIAKHDGLIAGGSVTTPGVIGGTVAGFYILDTNGTDDLAVKAYNDENQWFNNLSGSLIAAPLNDWVENSDYHFRQHNSDADEFTIPSGIYTVVTNLTFTPDSTDDYIIFASTEFDTNNAASGVFIQLRINGIGPKIETVYTLDNAGEYWSWSYSRVHNFLGGASVDIDVYVYAESATSGFRRTNILALKASSFVKFTTNTELATSAPSTNYPTYQAIISPTSLVSEENSSHLVIANAIVETSSVSDQSVYRLYDTTKNDNAQEFCGTTFRSTIDILPFTLVGSSSSGQGQNQTYGLGGAREQNDTQATIFSRKDVTIIEWKKPQANEIIVNESGSAETINITITADASQTESGAGSSEATSLALLSLLDDAPASDDQSSVQVQITINETAIGIQFVSSLTVDATVLDFIADTEIIHPKMSAFTSDSASGIDETPLVNGLINHVDTGTVLEDYSSIASIPLQESNDSVDELPFGQIDLSVADLISAAIDEDNIPQKIIPTSDAGTGSESVSITSVCGVVDLRTSSEPILAQVSLALSDDPITSDDVEDVSDRLHFVTDSNQSALDSLSFEAFISANDSAAGGSNILIDKDALIFVSIDESGLFSDDTVNSIAPIEILDSVVGESFLSPINASVSSSEGFSSNDVIDLPEQLTLVSDQLTNVSELLSNFTTSAFVSTITESNESLFIDTEGASAAESPSSYELFSISNLSIQTESGIETTDLSINIDPFEEFDSATAIEGLSITQSTSLTDQLSGADDLLISNYLLQEDAATGVFDLSSIQSISQIYDNGISIHTLNILASTDINENPSSIDAINAFITEAHSTSDSATTIENPQIYIDDIVYDIATSIETPSETNSLFEIDDAYSFELPMVVGTLVVNGHDNATTITEINVTQVEGAVFDVGTSIETVGISTETRLYDYASDADFKFVYDDKQKLVNILFDMRLRRILFNLNTAEDHTDES